jgi:hypothetical protein
MGDIIQQTVGGLSVAILVLLVVLVYGHSYSTTDEKEAKAPFGGETKLFWNAFVGLTVAVLLVVLVVGFLGQPAATPKIHVVVSESGGSSFPSAMSTGSGFPSSTLSDLSSFSSFSTLSTSLDSFSSSDISTSLGALSDSLSSISLSV